MASDFPPNRALIAGQDWFSATRSKDYPAEQQQLDAILAGVLGAESLTVLSGLGTSLGIRRHVADGAFITAGAPTMGDLFEEVEKLPQFEAAARLAEAAIESRNVESLLSTCQFKIALDGDPSIKEFVAGAEAVILRMCSFIDANTDLGTHETFLRKISRRQTRLARTQIFTTNYDLAFERAAERMRATVIDGFGFGSQRAFDGNSFDLDVVRRRRGETVTLEPQVLHLLKLHGSVDWDERNGEVHRAAIPTNPVLIYPSQDKFQLSFRPPYLESMSRFQIALRQPDVALIVARFGFNDAHIVAPIEAALRSNIGLRLVVVDPFISKSTNDSIKRLTRLVESGDRRVTLLETTFDQFVNLLPDVGVTDEREVHELRTHEMWVEK